MLKSILKHRCPRCRKGKLFLNDNPYNFKEIGKMPESCPHCGQSYSPEPGFYFGATYVSYAFAVAFYVTGFGINWLFIKAAFDPTIITLSIIFALITPVIFRYSRTVWIHFFVRYEEGL